MNGCAPSLALIERLKATRKWAIVEQFLFSHYQAFESRAVRQLVMLLLVFHLSGPE